MATQQNYLRTDEHEDAVGALESVAAFVQQVEDNPYMWKWTLIALHGAVQGFMVLALRHGSGLLALRDDIAAKWLKAYRDEGEFPTEKLDSFLSLYEKIKSDSIKCYVHSEKFAASAAHDRSVRQLNELRNQFIHFVPRSWSIEISGLPGICSDCLSVVEFLGWQCGNVIWHKPGQRLRGERALTEARKYLSK